MLMIVTNPLNLGRKTAVALDLAKAASTGEAIL